MNNSKTTTMYLILKEYTITILLNNILLRNMNSDQCKKYIVEFQYFSDVLCLGKDISYIIGLNIIQNESN